MHAPVTPQLRQAVKREIVKQMEEASISRGRANAQRSPHASYDGVSATQAGAE